MKITISKQHLLFCIAYLFTMLTLLLYQINALPAPTLLRKTKYLYVLLIFILVLLDGRIKRNTFWPFFTLFLFFLHTVLFGYIYTNNLVAVYISDNASMMIWFLLMTLVTYIYISQNNLFRLFINLSFFVTGFQLLLAGFLHPNDFTNPIWGLFHAFTADIRYKTSFGFVHPGYTSNACSLVIILSIFFYEVNKNSTGNRRRIMQLSFTIINFIATCMLFAAAERAGIISTFIVLAFYFVFVKMGIRIEKKTFHIFLGILAVVLVILEASGVFHYIWTNSNRSLNITVNYPVFLDLGNQWTGMGYVDNSSFNEAIMAFGVRTSSLDMYYVYIFFTTGIVGCIIIGIALFIMLFCVIRKKNSNLGMTALGLYISMLFYAFWQCSMVTYRYVSSMLFFLIILFSMSKDFCMGSEKMHSLRRNYD